MPGLQMPSHNLCLVPAERGDSAGLEGVRAAVKNEEDLQVRGQGSVLWRERKGRRRNADHLLAAGGGGVSPAGRGCV